MIAHGHRIFNNSITSILPKKQTLELSKGILTKYDYKKGLGNKDIFAVVIILSTLFQKETNNLFINELLLNFPKSNIVLSSGKTLLSTLGLPDDFLDRLNNLEL